MMTYESQVIGQDGIHTGGQQKLLHMQARGPAIKPNNNATLHALLTEIARLCYLHYASVDIAALEAEYDPKPGARTPDESTVPEAAPGTMRRKMKPVFRGGPAPAPIPADLSSKKTLLNHDDLLNVFAWYGGLAQNENNRYFRWPATDLTKSKDLFKNTTVAPRYNNAFSSSFHTSAEGSNERPAKMRKGNDGQALPGVHESHDEEESAEQ